MATLTKEGKVIKVFLLLIAGFLFSATEVQAANPVLTVSTLADGSYTNNPTLNIPGSVTVDSGLSLDTLTLIVNGGTPVNIPFSGDTGGPYSFSYALTLTNGANQLILAATDSVSNTINDTRTITLDITSPTITITSPADNSATGTIPIAVSGSVDKTSTVTVQVNGSSPQTFSNVTVFTASVDLSLGLNTILVDATDLAGNNAAEQKRTVTYDNTKPALSVTDPAQDIATNQATITITGSVSDTYSAVTVTVAVDGGTPYTPAVAPDGTFTQDITFTNNKTYQITVTATNAAGIFNTVTRNFIFDNVPPQVTGVQSTTASGYYNLGKIVNITLNFSEPITSSGLTIYLNTTPVKSVSTGALANAASFSGTYTVANGDNTAGPVNVTAIIGTIVDAAGNSTANPAVPAGQDLADSKNIVIDTTPPVVNANPAGGILYRNVQFTQTATANDATPMTYAWSMQSGPSGGNITFGSPGALTTTISADANVNGSYILRFTAIDAAGNSNSSSVTLVWDTVPSASPVITPSFGQVQFTKITTGNFKFTSTDSNVTFTCSMDDPDPNTSATGACTSPSQYNFTSLPDGSHTFKVTATDPATNQSSSIYTWTIDTTTPLLTVSILNSNTHTSVQALNVSGAATDPGPGGIGVGSGVSSNSLAVTLNNNPAVTFQFDSTTGQFSQDLNLTLGSNNITITATDLAGNTTSVTRSNIVYDPNAPVITFTSPADNYVTSRTPVTVTGTVSKNVTFQAAVQVNNGQPQQLPSPPGNNTFTLAVNLQSGINTITITATDANDPTLYSSQQLTIIFDNTPPSLTVTDPAQNIRTLLSSYSITGSVSDTQNGTSVAIDVDTLVGGIFTNTRTFQPTVDVNGKFTQAIDIPPTFMYRFTVKATDAAGNETDVQRKIISGAATGDINGDTTVNVADALLALQIAVGIVPPADQYLVLGDVAPVVNGTSTGDWKISVGDAVVILQKSIN